MKNSIKRLLQFIASLIVRILIPFSGGRFLLDGMLRKLFSSAVSEVEHHGVRLRLMSQNTVNRFRVATFSSKEPETLDWIDRLPEGSVLWDIGANVGLYSCYAAKKRRCKVIAFEPSVFNVETLARNIMLNELVESVSIFPLPLSESRMESKMNMSSTEWGGAMSTFHEDVTHDGSSLKVIFQFTTYGLSVDDAVSLLKVPSPDYIKMDVDGIEHLILRGCPDVLARVKGVLVEINDDYELQRNEAQTLLASAGLVMQEKRRSEIFDGTPYASSYNQIWIRSGTN